jgi:hypothetical protein
MKKLLELPITWTFTDKKCILRFQYQPPGAVLVREIILDGDVMREEYTHLPQYPFFVRHPRRECDFVNMVRDRIKKGATVIQ